MLYESQKKVINLFADYSMIISETRHASIHGKGLKIVTSKQMFQRLLLPLAQIKASNTSEHLLNEIRQIIYSLYQAKEIIKKAYNNIMNLNKGIIQNGYYI